MVPRSGATMIKGLSVLVSIFLACSHARAQTVPPPVQGFGSLSVVNSNALVSTMTLGPNSTAWPTSGNTGMVFVVNTLASAGNLYVCPLGGACTTSSGLEITPGHSWGFYRPSTSMTVIATTTATAQFQW